MKYKKTTLFIILILILSFNGFSQETDSENISGQDNNTVDLSKSVVELRVTTQEFDYHSPWQRKSYDTSWQFGIVISEDRKSVV